MMKYQETCVERWRECGGILPSGGTRLQGLVKAFVVRLGKLTPSSQHLASATHVRDSRASLQLCLM